MAAEREQPRVVAIDKRFERAMIAAAYQPDELLVALKPQKR
jgi:hypothetical protein